MVIIFSSSSPQLHWIPEVLDIDFIYLEKVQSTTKKVVEISWLSMKMSNNISGLKKEKLGGRGE